jgi:hypothetical protein
VKQQHFPESIDPKLYPNRWIAVVRGRVIGVGLTAQQAYRAAKQTRRKDKPLLFFVDAEGKVEPREQSASVDE